MPNPAAMSAMTAKEFSTAMMPSTTVWITPIWSDTVAASNPWSARAAWIASI